MTMTHPEDLTASPPPAPSMVLQLVIELAADTEVMAFTPCGGVQLHLGHRDDVESTPVVIVAPTPAALVELLYRSIAAVATVDPSSDPWPGPDPRVIEARDIVKEDILRLAGDPVHAGPRELEEFSISDLKTIRRLASHLLGVLDQVVDFPQGTVAR